MRALAAALLALLPDGQEPPRAEKVTIPGTEVAFDLVYVRGGKLATGGRTIEVGPYWIGRHEVTWEEYSLYYESHKQAKVDGITRPSQPDVIDPKDAFENGETQGPRHPALSVGWYGAAGYCEWLSKKTGMAFRLPTEAEWEFACRANAPEPAWVQDVAWTKENSGDHTHEVGLKKPNAFGLHDMLGNAWEQTLEPWAPPAFEPVVRGGGWETCAPDVWSGSREPIPDLWAERDPKLPLRLWWLTDGNFVTFRVVRLAGADPKALEEAAPRLELKNLRIVEPGKKPHFLDRVRGEVAWKGDRPIDELEITVYFLDEDGKPMLKDPKDKPAYNMAWPVLASSWHDGPHRAPLKPGDTRVFELDVPHPFIEAGPLELDKVAAKVTRVRLAP